MSGRVVIDYYTDSVRHYREGYAIVATDVVRATTTAISCVELGWRCYPVPSLERALPLAAKLERPLLVGELGGNMPYGFDETNSPAKMSKRTDTDRPVILLSSSGTRLVCEAESADAAYLACFRNVRATADYVARRHQRIAVLGAGTRGEFREEDQMCCALVAAELVKQGFRCEDDRTQELIDRWSNAPPDAWTVSKSVGYLRNSNQADDLEFVLAHVEDLTSVFMLKHGEVTRIRTDDESSDEEPRSGERRRSG